jgi:dTDP-4-amino-4,6-dideoxygalactose transaminase
MFRAIFQRQYYTNHGPLTQELEEQLADRLQVAHAICVTNEYIGLVAAAHALTVQGRVVVPAHAPSRVANSLAWTAAEPLFSDVDPSTGMMTAALVEPLLVGPPVSAILAVNFWGDACDVLGLETLARKHGIPIYFDSSKSFGCRVDDKLIGGFGQLELLSLCGDSVLGSCDGAVVCTNDDDIAAIVRTMRSSYGAGRAVPVAKTGNGRLSEAQAAIALFLLEHAAERQAHNLKLFERFQQAVVELAGFEVRCPTGVTESNYHSLICLLEERTFGITRDQLLQILHAENVAVGLPFDSRASTGLINPPVVDCNRFPLSANYFSRAIELPIGPAISEADIAKICDLLHLIHRGAHVLRSLFSTRS